MDEPRGGVNKDTVDVLRLASTHRPTPSPQPPAPAQPSHPTGPHNCHSGACKASTHNTRLLHRATQPYVPPSTAAYLNDAGDVSNYDKHAPAVLSAVELGGDIVLCMNGRGGGHVEGP